MKNEIIDAVSEHRIMDFVTNNEYLLDKRDLVNLVREMDYAIYSELTEKDYAKVMEELGNLLRDTETW